MDGQIEVKLRGSFSPYTGYGRVNINLLTCLHQNNIIVEPDPIKKTELSYLPQTLKHSTSNNAICIDSIVPTIGAEGFGKYRIIYTTIESSTLPQTFIDQIKNYHEIWVTSTFCQDILKKYDINSIVIPDSINIHLYNKEGKKENLPLNPFVFVSVGGWNYRKGFDSLLKSYLQEFTDEDPVSLLLITKHYSKKSDIIQKEINEYIKKYGGQNPPHISRCTKDIKETDMPNIYRSCSAFVLLTRGEGFCIPACEASLCGCPVIMTNYSGHTMFCNNKNSYLINIDYFSPLQEGLMHTNYWDKQQFPSLSSELFIKECQKTLRYVFNNYKKAQKKNDILIETIKENYNIKSVGNQAKQHLQKIWEKL